jgi:hypothetical protein
MRPATVLLTAALLAAPARPADPADDAKTAVNNLKLVGLAFHAHHDATGGFPADVADKAGKPLLSWRVAILPFLGEEEGKLYRQFKLAEPWDSEHNKALAEKLPKVYAPVGAKAKAGETFLQVFAGPKALFGGKVRNPRLLSITDGTSNTGMVFEAGEPVVWTKPADLPFDEAKPLPKLGGQFGGAFHVVMCDGSVRRVKAGADEKELKKLVMPADGNPIDWDKLTK